MKEFKAGDAVLNVRQLTWGERKKAKKAGLFKRIGSVGSPDGAEMEDVAEEALAVVLTKKEMALVDEMQAGEVIKAFQYVIGISGPDKDEEKN